MNINAAKKIVVNEMGTLCKISLVKETPTHFIFMCTNEETSPSKIAVAVNKRNGKLGGSILSYEEAVAAAR